MAENDRELESVVHSDTEEGTQSRRSSITHPYRALMEDTSFARCHLLASPQVGPETYTRSLSMLGHGIPLWDPIGSLSRSKKHLESGINIGDVGYLSVEGDFLYLFNIFSTATDAVQVECPPDMEPLSSPEPVNIVKNETHFPPGTTFVSKGVTVSRLAASPLDIKFTIDARESGILILPDGASREDLVSTDLVRDFVHKHALDWYRFINRGSNSLIACPNGYLYVITGCDKTTTFAVATSAPNCKGYSGNLPIARYQDNEWKGGRGIATKASNAAESAGKCAVVIRGMRVAINPHDWTKYILHNEPPSRPSYYHMLAVPVTGLRAKYQTIQEGRSNYSEKYVYDGSTQIMFHPLEVVLRFLFEESPKAGVAIAEDILWCPLVDNSDGSFLQITRLMKKIFEEHEISEENGLVTLMPLRQHLKGPHTSGLRYVLLRVPNLVMQEYQARRRRWIISSKLAKIFPGPGLPAELLKG